MLRFLQKSQDEEKELQAENGQIFHCLQNSLTSASLASIFFRPLHLHLVFICETYVLLQLREFWDSLQSKLLDESLYTTIICSMRLRLHELQAKDKQARKTRAEHSEGWDNINGVLYYQGLFYVPEIIRIELISRHHNNQFAGHFDIEKTRELILQKYN